MGWSRHVVDGGHRSEDSLSGSNGHGAWDDVDESTIRMDPPQKLLRPVGHAPRRRHDTGPVPTVPTPGQAPAPPRARLTPPRGQPRLPLPTPPPGEPRLSMPPSATPLAPPPLAPTSPALPPTLPVPPVPTVPPAPANGMARRSPGLPPAHRPLTGEVPRVTPGLPPSRRPPTGEVPRLTPDLPPTLRPRTGEVPRLRTPTGEVPGLPPGLPPSRPTPAGGMPGLPSGLPPSRPTPAGGMPGLPSSLPPVAGVPTTLPAPTGPARTSQPTPAGGLPRLPDSLPSAAAAPSTLPARTSRPTPAEGQPRVPRSTPPGGQARVEVTPAPGDALGEAQAREVELAFGDKGRLRRRRKARTKTPTATPEAPSSPSLSPLSSPSLPPSPPPTDEGRRRLRVGDDTRIGRRVPAAEADPTGPVARRRAERERQRADAAAALPAVLPADMPPTRSGRGPLALVIAAVVGALVAVAAFVVLTRDGGDDELLGVVVDSTIARTNGVVTQVEAECMSEAVIRSVGRERLTQLGALDGADALGALSTAERLLAVPRAFDCLDDERVLDVFVATWPEDAPADLGPELAPCVYQGWWDGMGRETVVHLYTSLMAPEPPPLDETLEPDDFATATEVLGACQSPPPTP